MKTKRGLFITGTGTDVGKTFVAAQIASILKQRGCNVGVYKPVASGCSWQNGQVTADDGVALWEAAGRPRSLHDVCPFRFQRPLAPHLAARAEGQELDFQKLIDNIHVWSDSEMVIVEGAGGLMSPIGDHRYVADLAYDFGFPLIVVSQNILGTINQTLQTLITASTFLDGLPIAGIVLNSTSPGRVDASVDTNFDELNLRCVPPVVAQVGWNDFDSLREVDWLSIGTNLDSEKSTDNASSQDFLSL